MGKSRPQRWADACAKARAAFDELDSAFGELNDIKDEYQEWRDGMPENLEQSPTAEKLDAIVELDFESALQDVGEVLDEAEGMDMPMGFGRD